MKREGRTALHKKYLINTDEVGKADYDGELTT